MKIIVLLLFLLPAAPTSQFKSLYFKIMTVDDKGKALPDCKVEVSSSGFLGVENYVSDKKGTCVIPWQAMKSVAFVARRRDYATQYLTFDHLEKYKNGDTLKGTMVMKYTVSKSKK